MLDGLINQYEFLLDGASIRFDRFRTRRTGLACRCSALRFDACLDKQFISRANETKLAGYRAARDRDGGGANGLAFSLMVWVEGSEVISARSA
jgi:hypothetical protein